MNMSWRVVVEHSPYALEYAVYVVCDRDPETFELADALDCRNWHEVKRGVRDVEPTVVIAEDVAKQLVEAFTAKNVRPDSESVNEGLLRAQGAHLQDMRTLVGKFTKTCLPEETK